MRIRWTPAAAADLQAIHDYLREHDPQLAQSTVIELRQGIRKLKQFPNMGRPGREEGTRELVHTRLPHIIAYRVKDDTVEILHIWHPAGLALAFPVCGILTRACPSPRQSKGQPVRYLLSFPDEANRPAP